MAKNLESELRVLQQRLEQLEQRRELLCKEHVSAVSNRRTLLLNGTEFLRRLIIGSLRWKRASQAYQMVWPNYAAESRK
jgi:hypothetical protein